MTDQARKRRQSNSETNLRLVLVYAYVIRLAVISILGFTDAIARLHLSPDSLRYHRMGVVIARQMSEGNFNWPNWIDHGWFQFNGLIYYLFGPHAVFIQIINASFSVATVAAVYHAARKIFPDERVARWTCMLVAFFPSFIYWSSLMLKDSLAIFAIAFMVLSVVSLRQKFEFRWVFALLVSLALILMVREYLFYVFIVLIAMSFVPLEKQQLIRSVPKLLAILLIIGLVPYQLGQGFLGIDFISNSMYFDLEYINRTRVAMGDHGAGRIYEDPENALWGQSISNDIRVAATGLFFFFFSIDLTSVGSIRQIMALPEVIIFILLFPALVRGVLRSWRTHRRAVFPVFLVTIGILIVYTSATTNMGAMYRWRMQALPYLLMMICYGLTLKRQGMFVNILRSLDRVFTYGRRRRRQELPHAA